MIIPKMRNQELRLFSKVKRYSKMSISKWYNSLAGYPVENTIRIIIA